MNENKGQFEPGPEMKTGELAKLVGTWGLNKWLSGDLVLVEVLYASTDLLYFVDL